MVILDNDLEPKKEKDPNKGIKFEKWIDASSFELADAKIEPSDYDFVKPIGKHARKYIFQAWDKGDKLENVNCYIGTWSKE